MGMERLEMLLDMIDNILEDKTRRYIVGGVLISVSLFFGGLAATVIIINKEEKKGYE